MDQETIWPDVKWRLTGQGQGCLSSCPFSVKLLVFHWRNNIINIISNHILLLDLTISSSITSSHFRPIISRWCSSSFTTICTLLVLNLISYVPFITHLCILFYLLLFFCQLFFSCSLFTLTASASHLTNFKSPVSYSVTSSTVTHWFKSLSTFPIFMFYTVMFRIHQAGERIHSSVLIE